MGDAKAGEGETEVGVSPLTPKRKGLAGMLGHSGQRANAEKGLRLKAGTQDLRRATVRGDRQLRDREGRSGS